MGTRVMTFAETKALFAARALRFPRSHMVEGSYLLVSGRCTIPQLRLDHGETAWERAHPGADLRGFVVDGHLAVEGNIVNWESTLAPSLAVLGALRAHNLALGAASLLVAGDLDVTECLHACDVHGFLDVRGSVRARAFVGCASYGTIGGDLAAPSFGSDHLEVSGARAAPVEAAALFVPEVLEPGGERPPVLGVDHAVLFQRLEAGLPVLRAGVATAPCLARARAAG
jgi:hypothetical protein